MIASKSQNRDCLARQAILTAISYNSLQPSTLFFTHHKCASTFIERLLIKIDNIKGIRTIDYEKFLWEMKDQEQILGVYASDINRFLNDMHHILYDYRGFVYGPMRAPLHIGHDCRFTRIFFLRDPRDTLVSLYHSIASSHPLPDDPKAADQLLNNRKIAQTQGINNFVIDQANTWLKPILGEYRQIVETSESNVHFFLYEDLLNNPVKIIGNIINIIFDQSYPELVTELLRGEKFIQEKICFGNHQRSGRIGQYQNELDLLTAENLTQLFQSDLEFFWGM
jgi:hypothetical protein